MQACRFEQAKRGSCIRGASCYYNHDVTSTSGLSGVKPNSTTAFSQGSIHPSASAQSSPPVNHPFIRENPRASIPCTFYHAGRCLKGDACPYLHAEPKPIPSKSKGANEDAFRAISSHPDEEPNEALHQKITRLFNGAKATFGAGCKVDQITLPQDFSTIAVTGLQARTTTEDILTLLEHVYGPVEGALIRLNAATPKSALITVQDSQFSSNICELLNANVLKASGFRNVQVSKVPHQSDFGASTQRLNFRTVLCSWLKPTKTVILCYYDPTPAYSVRNKFVEGRYLLAGRNIKSKVIPRPPFESPYGFAAYKQFHVYLYGVQCSIHEEELEAVLEFENKQPFEIVSIDSHDVYKVVEEVKTTVAQAGPVESFTMVERTLGTFYKAVVVFRDESDASHACESPNDIRMHCSQERLRVCPVVSTKIKISTLIFDPLKADIDRLDRRHESVHFKCYRNNDVLRRLTTIKLSGNDVSRVSSAKVALDALLEGHVAQLDGRNIWHKSFAQASGTRLLHEIQVKHHVVAIRDYASSALRLYGADRACAAAIQDVAKAIKVLDEDIHEIRLSNSTFTKVLDGVYSNLQEMYGQRDISLQITPASKKLVVRGSLDRVATVRQKLGESGIVLPSIAKDDCSICFTPAERPVRLRCGHVYCGDCFENMCQATASGDVECSIACQGASDSCKQLLSLEELHEHLTSSSFEAILKASFWNYVRHKPDDYRACPTTDCGQLYRPASAQQSATVHHCLKCLNAVCLSCHACHGRLTCGQWRYIANGEGEATKKTMRKLGIKECPQCKTPLEKTEGCNHVECRACKTHICWVCLLTFENGPKTYSHMNTVHGTIGLEDVQGRGLENEEEDSDEENSESEIEEAEEVEDDEHHEPGPFARFLGWW